jgi:hypothetical protein
MFVQRAIPAEICSSDRAKRAGFDASRWFATATIEKLVELARRHWRGDPFIRELALDCAGSDDAVADVLQYVMYLRHGGLRASCRCSIDSAAALRWLSHFRPAIAAALRRTCAHDCGRSGGRKSATSGSPSTKMNGKKKTCPRESA